jgi:hypothetical protein
VNSSSTARTSCACAAPNCPPSAPRSRRIARACNCDTRDSLTPISVPICFIVTSP